MARKLPLFTAAVAAVALAVTTLTGCSSSSSTSSSSSGSATSGNLTVDWQPSYKPSMDWLIKQFEAKYPKAHVKANYVDQSQYFSLIRTQLQAGTAPDIFWTTPGNGNPTAMAQFQKNNYLADLSDSPWVNDIQPAIAKYGKVNGKTYMLQTDIEGYGVVYNDQAMQKAGLTAPQSWDQVLQFCAAARSKGLTPYALGAQDLFETQQFIFSTIPTLVYKADPSYDAKQASGKTGFDKEPGWQETMTKYKQALDAQCFTDRPAGTSFNTVVNDLGTGKTLGNIGTHLITSPATAVNPQATFTFMPFPAGDDPWLMVGAFGGAGVNAKSKNLKLAKTFVNFLGTSDIMNGYSQQGPGDLPTIVGKTPFTPGNDAQKLMAQYLKDGKTSGFVDQTWPNSDVQQAMYQQTQSMLAGRAQPADVLKAMQAAWPTTK